MQCCSRLGAHGISPAKVLILEDSVGLPSKDIWIAWDAPQAELLSPWHSGVGQPGLWARQTCHFFSTRNHVNFIISHKWNK
jgi:hypothetical protein